MLSRVRLGGIEYYIKLESLTTQPSTQLIVWWHKTGLKVRNLMWLTPALLYCSWDQLLYDTDRKPRTGEPFAYIITN